MLSWLQSGWETHASQNIYCASYTDGAFNALVNSLPIQTGVWDAILVLFTFSLRFLTHSTLPFFHFRELSFQRSHWRLLTSTIVDFLVSSRISNILFITGLFYFCGWGHPTRFCEGFQFAFS